VAINAVMADAPVTAALRATVTLQENVLDRLAEILFEVDDLRDVLRSADAHVLAWAAPEVEHVFDSVNHLMQKLAD
jgi:hypothetical protein